MLHSPKSTPMEKLMNNFPKEWKEVKLGDYISTNDSSLNKNDFHEKIQYLDTGSISNNNIDKLQDFNLWDAPSRAKRLVENEDIIYSSVRPNQRHYGFIENPAENLVVSTGFVVIKTDKKELYPKFLYYLLSSDELTEYLHTIAEASTSAYPSLKPSDIEALEVAFPAINEQKAIAEVLASLDDKIDLLHRQNKTLEQMAEILFRQWFVEEADDSWEEGKLGDFVSIIDNRGKTPPNQNEETPFPLIEVNALGKLTRIIDYSVVRKYVSLEVFNTWFRQYLSKYDILLSTVGSIGAISMFLSEVGNVAQNVIGLKAQRLSPLYLYQTLKYRTEEIMQLDIGGVQPSIKVPHLLDLIISIPSKDKQDNFDELAYDFVDQMEKNQHQIQKLKSLRDTLLPKLMSGKVRVVI